LAVFDEIRERFKRGTLVADRFEIQHEIGRGGAGIVFICADRGMDGASVALKIIDPSLIEDSKALARFQREASIAQGLTHANIVQVHTYGKTLDGCHFIAMEYVDGTDLRSRLYKLTQEPLSFEECAAIIRDIARALEFAHQFGVIHRDVKPANIMLAGDGLAKLADFGCARPIFVENSLTATGETVGSVHYMSPEQVVAQQLDSRSDLYSLGIVAYELVMKKRPFEGGNVTAICNRHVNEKIEKFAEAAGIPAWYEGLVFKATEKKPDKRFQSAEEISLVIEKELRREAARAL